MKDQSRKLFVLDTNVILHDSNCIRNFQEHDVAIPITVLEELDKFKRGNEDIHFQARQFLRELDQLTGDLLSTTGAPLGPGRGGVRVILGAEQDDRIASAFLQNTPDHRILNTAASLQKERLGRRVILVSKDTNLRMKAKGLGVLAQDYTSDKIESFDKLYMGKRVVEDVDADVIGGFYTGSGKVSAGDLPGVANPIANENFVLRAGSKSVLVSFKASDNTFVRVEKKNCYGINPRNAEQSFAVNALLDDDVKLVTLAGTAGTGKTLLALAAALECRQPVSYTHLTLPTNREV